MGSPASQSYHTLIQLLPLVPYLEGLPDEVLAALALVATREQVSTGEVIFWEGDPVSGLFVVEEGVVKISRISKEGREHILHLIHRGDTFNDVASMDGGPNPATATAHTDVVVWRIRRDDLQHIVDRFPRLAWALLESMARRARHLVGLVEDLAMRSVKGRLARLLLEQAEANQANAVPRLLTQEEIASQLGTVREMVGRALRSLAADGIIRIDRHRIIVLDPARLEEEADV